jgi:beta-phosphoglucomutase-like phosphatase (HAD superfamily)
VVFEDSRFGVAAAQAAGMHAIAVLGTEPPERLAAADLVLAGARRRAARRLTPSRSASPRSCAASWSNAPKPAAASAGVSVAMPLRNS